MVIALLSFAGAFALHTWAGSDALPSAQTVRTEPESPPPADRDALAEGLYEALAAGEREIRFSYDCSDVLFDVFREILAEHPELFWLTGSGSLVKKTAGQNVTVDFIPEIPIGDDEIASRTTALNERIGEILLRCEAGETLWDRLLLLHDILVDETEYDAAAAELLSLGTAEDDELHQSASAYGCLVNRRAVCSGYAAAFQLMAVRLGAECRRVKGIELRDGAPHEWNLLNLDGAWYHVDVTWDDPVFAGDALDGYRSYDYFCVTTDEILENHALDDPDSCPSCTAAEANYYARLGCVLDFYDFDEVSRVVEEQAGNECVYLKFPDEETAEDALARLLKGQEVFDIPAVCDLEVKTVRGAASETGSVCLWLFRS